MSVSVSVSLFGRHALRRTKSKRVTNTLTLMKASGISSRDGTGYRYVRVCGKALAPECLRDRR